MTNLTRIVAAVVDTKKALLYKSDGTTIEILQGDARLRPILEQITPELTKQGWADIDLTTENSWKKFEEESKGAVRLFRIAKSKLASFFGTKKEEVTLPGGVDVEVIGRVPNPNKAAQEAIALKNLSAVDEIIKHATPVTADNFHEDKVATQRPTVESHGQTPNDKTNEGKDSHFDKHEDTIIAVTPKGQVVAGVERIKSQFHGAAESGNTKGMVLFLERVASVAKQRKHTSEDLLRFMERGDLPVADDGSIVIYKKLYREGGHYVDCHTGLVKQRVGSYVHMDVSLVDHNRRNECSNGLHVARRGYVGSFSGDVIVIAKVRPEDVIAVPDYDANKMRVCGYHIIAELDKVQYQAINGNRPLSDATGGEELLGQVIAGDHIGITEQVKIGGQKGTNVVITKIVTGDEPPEQVVAEEPKVETNADVESIAEELDEIVPVPKAKPDVVRKKVSKKAKKAKRKVAVKKAVKQAAAKAVKPLEAAGAASGDVPVDVRAVQKLKDGGNTNLAVEKKAPLTQVDVVKDLWDRALAGNNGAAKELLDFKKQAKKGWHTWGLPDTAGDTLKALLAS